jgi:GT2 family glycosyltransferase
VNTLTSPLKLSVIICTFNGADGLGRCLGALANQTLAEPFEVIVVDDGSTDDSVQIAERRGARVVLHASNRGLAAARNTGVLAASGEIVALVDDDCEPAPDWAQALLAAYDEDTLGVGGPIEPGTADRFMGRFLQRNNPLRPLEPDLAASDALVHRLRLYLRRQWRPPSEPRRYAAPALVGANMSFRRAALVDAGLFDPTFTFGAEDVELGLRITRSAARGRLVFDPRPRVVHHFRPTLPDALRRSRSYGRGAARLHTRQRSLRPAIFPLPVAVLALLALALRRPRALLLAALAPQLWFPQCALGAWRDREAEALIDPYIKVLQEAAGNLGVLEGLRATLRAT